MHVILLALGLIMCVAGIALIGFGIPINAANLGGTLITAGTIAIVGSLILIGLASAIRQLRRIAQVLEAQPLPRELGLDTSEPLRAPVLTPPVVSQPRSGAAPGLAPAAVTPVPEPRPAAAETEALRASPADRALPPATENRASSEPAPSPEPAMKTPAENQAPREPAVVESTFAAAWPGAPTAGARREHAAAAAPVEHDTGASAEPAEEVRILKSGVIDGMAYTLYTDGSLEAELAQGTVKFSSVEELRRYLAERE
jgi:hypothetical protein